MATELFDEMLVAAAFDGERAALRVAGTYEPVGGPASRVFPPTYPPERGSGGRYLFGSRWLDGVQRADVLLDGWPSQANRVERALLRARRSGVVEIPLMELRHCGAVDVVLSSLEWPHRYADAYLRDSLLDGVPFDETELGRSLGAASPDDATALFRADPGSLVLGAWNSHRRGLQQKFPRVYASEIVGWDPVPARRSAGRSDPLNLVGAAVRDGRVGPGEWEFVAAAEKRRGARLSEIGHGSVPPVETHGGVTISSAQRIATLSFAGLDRLGFGAVSREAGVAARAALAAYALMGDRLAFAGPSVWLRSGCELVLTSERVEWVNRGGSTSVVEVDRAAAVELFRQATEHAADRGLAMRTDTVELTPSPSLAAAIDFAATKAEPAEE